MNIALDICRGMIYTNSQWAAAIVHRDLKPSNVLVGKARVAKITDFGLAQISGEQRLDPGRGTPPYMSPEQWCDGPLDTRSADLHRACGDVLLALQHSDEAAADYFYNRSCNGGGG